MQVFTHSIKVLLVSVWLLVLVVPSCQAQALRRRQQQGCRLPDTTGCDTTFNPVECAGCVYANSCIATQTGWFGCTATCPTSADSSNSCSTTDDIVPVECGNSKCNYDNSCLGQAAGFTPETDCTKLYTTDTCPRPLAGSGMCPLDLNPVVCANGICPYDNACLAERSGFVDDCAPIALALEECPQPAAGTACGFILLPVVCQGCRYSNECLANAAGLTDCSSASAQIEPCTGSDCPPVPTPYDNGGEQEEEDTSEELSLDIETTSTISSSTMDPSMAFTMEGTYLLTQVPSRV